MKFTGGRRCRRREDAFQSVLPPPALFFFDDLAVFESTFIDSSARPGVFAFTGHFVVYE